MIPVPQFTDPSYMDRTSGANLQLMQDFIPEQTPTGWKLVSLPGYVLVGTVANNAGCRPGSPHYTTTGQIFSIHGNTVYEVFSDGTSTSRGTISTTTGAVTMTDNGVTLFIVVDAVNAYTVTLSAGSPTLISDANFPSLPTGAAFLDGYFITIKSGTGQFYLSQLYDGTNWTPITFATAEYAGDTALQVKRIGSQLYLFGTQTIEAWYNTGNADFPLERVNGATLNIGLGAPLSIGVFGDNCFFMGSPNGGTRPIYQIGAGGMKKISTPYIESAIAEINSALSGWEGYCYSVVGHNFYVIKNLNGAGIYQYDIDTGIWTEPTFLYSTYSIAKIINTFGNALKYGFAFDEDSGKIFDVKEGYNSMNGSSNVRARTFGPFGDGSRRIAHSRILFVLDAKFDSTPPTTFTGVVIDWTDDGGRTYSSSYTPSVTIAASTSSQQITVEARRLGMAAKRYYRMRCTGAARFIFTGCYLDAEEGGS